MAEPAPGWWKLTFLRRKKSQSKVFYEIPAEHASNTGHGNAAATATATATATAAPAAAAAAMGQDVTTSSSSSLEAGGVQDTELSARLERIVDKSASRGRHVKVSNSGRFKEKKRVRATLLENPEVFPGADGTRGESQRTGKGQQT